jgi:cell division septation protein DedD
MAGQSGDDFDRDILDIIPARYDADADSRQARAGSRLRATVTLVAAVVAVGGIVAAGWHFLGSKKVAGPGMPVIKAEDRPIKIRPDDRGGMHVPNQDKLVYERLSPNDGDAKVERLLPTPEAPKPPPPVEQRAPEPVKPAQVTAAPPPQPATPSGKPAAVSAPVPAPAPTQAAAPEPKAPVTETIRPQQMAQAKPVPAPAPAKTASLPAGDYLIQLGALRSAPDAEREWTRIQKLHGDLLAGLKSDVMRVDLGAKGVFWRLRAGPLSEAAAKQVCADLKTRNQGCILARK